MTSLRNAAEVEGRGHETERAQFEAKIRDLTAHLQTLTSLRSVVMVEENARENQEGVSAGDSKERDFVGNQQARATATATATARYSPARGRPKGVLFVCYL